MLVLTMIAIALESYVIWQLILCIDAAQKFRNILGTDVRLSNTPNETFASPSLVHCALNCEMRSGCQAYNMRPNIISMKTCDLYYYKEPDIINKSERENGSVYFEKVFF